MWSCDAWHKLKLKIHASLSFSLSLFLNSMNLHHLPCHQRWNSALVCHSRAVFWIILYAICSFLTSPRIARWNKWCWQDEEWPFVFLQQKNTDKYSTSDRLRLILMQTNGILNIMQRVGSEVKVGWDLLGWKMLHHEEKLLTKWLAGKKRKKTIAAFSISPVHCRKELFCSASSLWINKSL